MARVALICPSAMGHVYPSLSIANSLRDRGHEIVFFQVAASGRNVQRIEQEGFACRVYGSPALQQSLNDAYIQMGQQQGLRAFRTLVTMLTSRVVETIQAVPGLLRTEQIECALIDQMMPGATAIAQAMKLPFASVSNALVLNRVPDLPPCFTSWVPDHRLNRLRNALATRFYASSTRGVLKVVNEYRKRQDLPAVDSLDANLGDAIQLTQQPEFFSFPAEMSIRNLHRCGPFINPDARADTEFPWRRLSGKPLVYMSLGTLQNRTTRFFRMVAEACVTLDVDLVISTGDARHRFDPELPGKPIVVPFAPQLELLEKASVCVTHAGLNTTLESLSAGVPLLAVPIANDQPGVAARIEYLGLGYRCPPKKVTAAGMRLMIDDLIRNRSIRQNLQAARRRLWEVNGCERAADLFERHVLGREVLRSTAPLPDACVRSPAERPDTSRILNESAAGPR